MKTICIIPCGSKKIWDINIHAGPTRAKDVYHGSFARKCQQYAETFYPESWCILSAKYGFLFPADIVPGPYNVTFNDKNTNPISTENLSRQVKKKGLDIFGEIIVLGGKNYTDRISEVFSDKDIFAPLKGCKGMGYVMGKLNEALLTNRKI
jgi:hypothetical protein